MTETTARCGKKFSYGRICRRLAGHRGDHATRLSIGEQSRLMGLRSDHGKGRDDA
jgi:hypothetical protein